ncbi:hypothetical protein K3495_g13091, partial [Podosphaera aphanis]
MGEELFNLHQKRTIHNSPPLNSKNFETVVLESEEVFIEWLELEKNQLEWQKQSEKKNPLVQDQPYYRKENFRLTYGPSQKVGCKATLTARNKLNEDEIVVDYDTHHQGHEPYSFEGWWSQRLAPQVRKWLSKVVALGVNHDAFRILSRPDGLTLDVLDEEGTIGSEPCEVSELARIINHDFNNYRRRHLKNVSRFDPSCIESLKGYVKHIEKGGGIATLSETNDDQTRKASHFYFAFCNKWQKKILERYSSVLCLDSTHNTCYALDDTHRKAYLYTIVVKHDVVGKGVPVAFMITSSEAQGPLASWLLWLKQSVNLVESPIFMIDCSKKEMAAITSAINEPEIRLCYWHMLRAIRMQATSKIQTTQGDGRKRTRSEDNAGIFSELRTSAVSDLISLIKTPTHQEFDKVWRQYKLKYSAHQDWIVYLTNQWMGKSETLWHGNRKGMLCIQTNNLVESWHSILKMNYLRGFRKQRTDMLVYRLLREILPDLRLKVSLVQRGVTGRKMDFHEKMQFQCCSSISSDMASQIVKRYVAPHGEYDDYVEVISVRSFEKTDKQYTITLDASRSLSRCSCSYMTQISSVCKHMFLAKRQLGYSICFATRNKAVPRHEVLHPATLIENSLGDSFQDDEGSPPDERLNLAEMKRIGDLVENIPQLSTKESQIIKRIKLDLSALEESIKQRQR